ncbi:MAG: hypothetical protein M0Z53_02365 [Thermaerobacter sp.]|nr:hypothetical protein [Thermaerobacter sp.]
MSISYRRWFRAYGLGAVMAAALAVTVGVLAIRPGHQTAPGCTPIHLAGVRAEETYLMAAQPVSVRDYWRVLGRPPIYYSPETRAYYFGDGLAGRTGTGAVMDILDHVPAGWPGTQSTLPPITGVPMTLHPCANN